MKTEPHAKCHDYERAMTADNFFHFKFKVKTAVEYELYNVKCTWRLQPVPLLLQIQNMK